jgi:hypothetical protein
VSQSIFCLLMTLSAQSNLHPQVLMSFAFLPRRRRILCNGEHFVASLCRSLNYISFEHSFIHEVFHFGSLTNIRISSKMAQLPLPNNDTSLGNAVAVEGDIVYMMGSFGNGFSKHFSEFLFASRPCHKLPCRTECTAGFYDPHINPRFCSWCIQ